MTGRSVPEWIGSTPDATIPPRVRVRVWNRSGGHCQSCTRRIAAGERWVCDHVTALINGGENREGNLQVLCDWCDRKVKTPADVAVKAKTARMQAKHLGASRPSKPFPGGRDDRWKKKVSGEVVRR